MTLKQLISPVLEQSKWFQKFMKMQLAQNINFWKNQDLWSGVYKNGIDQPGSKTH